MREELNLLSGKVEALQKNVAALTPPPLPALDVQLQVRQDLAETAPGDVPPSIANALPESPANEEAHQDQISSVEPPQEPAPDSQDSQSEKQNNSDSSPHLEPPPPASSGSGLESQIGSVWLNRVGVATLLVGLISLLMYSIQYFSPLLRVAVGLLISAGIIIFSHRRDRAEEKQKVFYEGLNALGWSLAYFVVYGAHFIEPLKITDSLTLELTFLAATACGAMANAVGFKSESTALLSSSFAFGALLLCLGSVDLSMFNIAFLIIAAAVTFVSIRQNWHALLFVCCALFFSSLWYCNFLYGFVNPDKAAVMAPNMMLNIIIISGWLLFNSSICFLKSIPPLRRWAVIGTSLISAFSAPHLLSGSIAAQNKGIDLSVLYAWIFGIIGGIYLLSAEIFKRRNLADIWALHLLIALGLLNASRWLTLTGNSGLCVDLCEIALLVAVGLRFNVAVFRYFAAFWALTAAANWQSTWPLMVCGVAASGLCVHLYQRPDFKSIQSRFEQVVFGPFFYVIANIFCFRLFMDQMFNGYQLLALILLACTNVVLGLKLRWTTCSVVAAAFLVASSACLWLSPSVWNSTLAAIMCFATAYYCRDLYAINKSALEKVWSRVMSVVGNLILFFAIGAHCSSTYISAGWGLQGLIMIAIGFYLQERSLRIFGLSLFAIVMLRLLFIDLAWASTVQRIISFIVAGAAFVCCSWAYNWFDKRLATSKTNASEEAQVQS